MCVDTTNCTGGCSECQHDKVMRSDTDKCPKCGGKLHWFDSLGEQDFEYAECVCGWRAPFEKGEMSDSMTVAALNRIRELEEQGARLTEALMRVQEMAHNASSGPMEPDTYWDIRAIAQEALK